MPTAIGIRFRRAGRLYYFDPNGFHFEVNEYAVVNTSRHLELGRVVLAATEVAREELPGELKKVVRKGDEQDVASMEGYQARADEALARFRGIVAERKLSIIPLQAEYSFDGANLAFQFASEEKIDYRGLALELAEVLKTRIELRQVGPRDRARIVEGMGRCGLSLCCSTWLIEPGNVTVKMAKDQNLPLNPTKISGVCGRLLCCLRYEHEMYLEGVHAGSGKQAPQVEDVQEVLEQAFPGDDDFLPAEETAKEAVEAAGAQTTQPTEEPVTAQDGRRHGRRRSRRRRRRRGGKG